MSWENHLGAISLIKLTFFNALLKLQLEIEEETVFFRNTLSHMPHPPGGDGAERVDGTFPVGAYFRDIGVRKEDGGKNRV